MRQRRLRDRRDRGVRAVLIEVSDATLAELIRRRLVMPEEIENPAAIAFAIGAALEDILGL
jgi:pimeloyl-CoA synthetase